MSKALATLAIVAIILTGGFFLIMSKPRTVDTQYIINSDQSELPNGQNNIIAPQFVVSKTLPDLQTSQQLKATDTQTKKQPVYVFDPLNHSHVLDLSKYRTNIQAMKESLKVLMGSSSSRPAFDAHQKFRDPTFLSAILNKDACDASQLYSAPGVNVTVLDVILVELQSSLHTDQLLLLPVQSKHIQCPRNPVFPTTKLPLTALMSYPGSGNTWVRFLLHQLTGFHTGAVYYDAGLLKTGFLGEGKRQGVVAVKTHSVSVPGTNINVPFEKVIFVVRNPYRANVAEFKRYGMNLGHTGAAGIIDGNSQGWKQHIRYQMQFWFYLTLHTLSRPTPTLIVFYEDLQENLLPELVRIANFLKVDGLTEFSPCCTIRDSEGKNHRKDAPQDLYSLFDAETRQLINSLLSELADILKDRYPVFSERIMNYILP